MYGCVIICFHQREYFYIRPLRNEDTLSLSPFHEVSTDSPFAASIRCPRFSCFPSEWTPQKFTSPIVHKRSANKQAATATTTTATIPPATIAQATIATATTTAAATSLTTMTTTATTVNNDQRKEAPKRMKRAGFYVWSASSVHKRGVLTAPTTPLLSPVKYVVGDRSVNTPVPVNRHHKMVVAKSFSVFLSQLLKRPESIVFPLLCETGSCNFWWVAESYTRLIVLTNFDHI